MGECWNKMTDGSARPGCGTREGIIRNSPAAAIVFFFSFAISFSFPLIDNILVDIDTPTPPSTSESPNTEIGKL